MPLYPLKFKPRLLKKIWGGRKFETVLGELKTAIIQIGENEITSYADIWGLMNTVVAKGYQDAQSTNFPARARGVAREIAKTKPDVVGFQELTTWRTGPKNDPGAVRMPCSSRLRANTSDGSSTAIQRKKLAAPPAERRPFPSSAGSIVSRFRR